MSTLPKETYLVGKLLPQLFTFLDFIHEWNQGIGRYGSIQINFTQLKSRRSTIRNNKDI